MTSPEQQSPIDLSGTVPLDSPRPAVDYLSGAFSIRHTGTTLSIVPDDAGALWAGPRRMALCELHFHHPAEHTVNTHRAEAEIHFVHADEDGQTCVLGVLVEEGPANAELAMLLEQAPEPGESRRSTARFDPLELLPAQRGTWRYEGSLTTPPFTEGVSWYVLATPLTAAAEELSSLRALFAANARPVQDRSGRTVWRCE